MKSLVIKLFDQNKKLFGCLLFLDLVVLLLHLLLGTNNHFFHLDFEQNFPTYFQSFKLIGLGGILLIFGLSKRIERKIKHFVLPLSFFLLFLGFDELFQVHENIYRIFEYFDIFHPSKIVEASMNMGYRSSLWILYYLPLIFIFVFWSGYWLRYFQSKMKSNTRILLISSVSFFIVIMAEILSSTGSYSENIYFWLVTIEEAGEMLLASTLIYVGSKILNKYIQ